MRESVDVVVPVRSGVAAAIERFRALEGVRLIVVDDGGEGVQAPEAIPGPGRGPGAARNAGARAATADWLLFLDADVQAPPDIAARLLREPLDADAVCGEVVDGPGRRPAQRWARARASMSQRVVLAAPRPFALTACLAVRRSAFEAVGGFAEDLITGEDADLCWRLGVPPLARLDVGVVHESRPTVRGLLAQRWWHGRAAAQLDERWPGALEARRLPGLAWWGVRQALAAPAARGDERAARLLDGPAALAFELGRRHERGGRPRPGYVGPMNWKRLTGIAKKEIDKRGGTEALKADAKEVQAALKGPGTAKDKAKSVADALKDPGAGRRP